MKFQAQVLGQKATLLLRPYRACKCFTVQTQGDALGFHMAPRWGWKGRVRCMGSSRGAGTAWFVSWLLPVVAGKAWFVARTLPVGLGRQGSSHGLFPWGWEGVVGRADTGRWEGWRALAWGTAEGRAAATEVPAWGFAGFLLGFGREIGSGPLGGGIGVGGAPALHDLDLGFFALLFVANG